jgi:hypothetical protein
MRIDLENVLCEMRRKCEAEIIEELEALRMDMEQKKQSITNKMKEEIEDLEEEHETELQKLKITNETDLQRERLAHEKRIELRKLDDIHSPAQEFHFRPPQLSLRRFESIFSSKPKKTVDKTMSVPRSFEKPQVRLRLFTEVTQVLDQGYQYPRHSASQSISEITPAIDVHSVNFSDAIPISPSGGKRISSSSKRTLKAELAAKHLVKSVRNCGSDVQGVLKSQEGFLKKQQEFLASYAMDFQQQTYAISEQFREVFNNVQSTCRLAITSLMAARNQELAARAQISTDEDDVDVLDMAKRFRMVRRNNTF